MTSIINGHHLNITWIINGHSLKGALSLKTRAVAPFFPDARTFHNIYKLQKHVLLRHQSYLIVFMCNKNLQFWLDHHCLIVDDCLIVDHQWLIFWSSLINCWPSMFNFWPSLINCWPWLFNCWPWLFNCWPWLFDG
jgi:hypothetical protein